MHFHSTRRMCAIFRLNVLGGNRKKSKSAVRQFCLSVLAGKSTSFQPLVISFQLSQIIIIGVHGRARIRGHIFPLVCACSVLVVPCFFFVRPFNDRKNIGILIANTEKLGRRLSRPAQFCNMISPLITWIVNLTLAFIRTNYDAFAARTETGTGGENARKKKNFSFISFVNFRIFFLLSSYSWVWWTHQSSWEKAVRTSSMAVYATMTTMMTKNRVIV